MAEIVPNYKEVTTNRIVMKYKINYKREINFGRIINRNPESPKLSVSINSIYIRIWYDNNDNG